MLSLCKAFMEAFLSETLADTLVGQSHSSCSFYNHLKGSLNIYFLEYGIRFETVLVAFYTHTLLL